MVRVVGSGEVGDGAADSAKALARVRDRLERFRDGDGDAVLAVEALSDAAAAVTGSATPVTPDAVAAVAWLYQYRALATGAWIPVIHCTP
ncbi:hypothetical protein [Streptomyces sp. NPDC006739]|uniref:hypothetical protein n=1 Tax=Streptomyces sp. NPDC006739 TaxID=3364763 RepID=UPI0036AE3756